jgi:excisionase family DNA binding protein
MNVTTAERETLTVQEAAKRLGIGQRLAYEMVREGRIPALRYGNRIIIPVPAFKRMLQEADAPAG